MLPTAMDGPHLLAYNEQILAPILKKGDIVFMDNVSTHLGRWCRRSNQSPRRKRFLPSPYSPDFNPIEQLFASLKSFLRKAKTPRRAALESHRLVSQNGIQRRMQSLPCKLGLRLT
jgi:transposase